MTSEKFIAICNNLGLTNGDIAMITGTTPRAVQFWRRGRSPVPQSVAILLDALSGGQLDMEWVVNWVATSGSGSAEAQ